MYVVAVLSRESFLRAEAMGRMAGELATVPHRTFDDDKKASGYFLAQARKYATGRLAEATKAAKPADIRFVWNRNGVASVQVGDCVVVGAHAEDMASTPETHVQQARDNAAYGRELRATSENTVLQIEAARTEMLELEA